MLLLCRNRKIKQYCYKVAMEYRSIMNKLNAVICAVAVLLWVGGAARCSVAGPIHFDAVKAQLEGAAVVAVDPSSAAGSNYVTHFQSKDDKIRFTVNAAAGPYLLQIRYRSTTGDKTMDGSVNGHGLSVHLPKTTDFAVADAGHVLLHEGDNTFEFGGGWGWYDIAGIDLTPLANLTRPKPVSGIPSDKHATPQVRTLMKFLAANYGKATLCGVVGDNDAKYVEQKTGKSPAIVAGDFIEYSSSRLAYGTNPNGQVEALVAEGRSGHIVTMLWHWNAPMHLLNTDDQQWWKGFYSSATTFDFEYALDHPASPEYNVMLADIDIIAREMQKFQDAGVPVLFRPLHEAGGNWFWWSQHGSKSYNRLWRLLYDRMTIYHHLHNIIWVYCGDPSWYPGDDVVDLVSIDAYPDHFGDSVDGNWQDEIKAFDGRKMIGISEFKTSPDIESMHRLQEWWSFITNWSGWSGPTGSTDAELKSYYLAPSVITKSELPKLDGTSRSK
jgi:mannan endo-1,4-beta-mannosidase